MDKYLVPIDITKRLTDSYNRGGKRLKQTKIQNLKGVVNIDEILRIKKLLKVPNQSTEVISKCLDTLAQKIPSLDVLKNTKIARVVRSFSKHKDAKVANKAKGIVGAWTAFYNEKLSKPKVDVLCGNETTAARETSRYRIRGLLSSNQKDEMARSVAEDVEREVFMRHKMIRKSYSLVIRKIVCNLEKNEDDLKARLLRGDLTCYDLVDQSDNYKMR